MRRDLHRHPEISGQEKRTAEFVTNYLLALGLEVKVGVGGYGVVGILKGKQGGKKIAWRADMDALKFDAQDPEVFGSIHKGINHYCGHDVHVTIALGMANVLAHHREQIKGTVYFIFQPSEENYKGAKSMISDGLFEGIAPEEMYAAHISPMPSGLVASKPGYLFADYKEIHVTYEASAADEEVIAFTKNLLSGLQNVPASSEFWDTQNLMDPTIGIGNPETIFQDYITVKENVTVSRQDGQVRISGILSASSASLMDAIPRRLQRSIDQSDFADRFMDIAFATEGFLYSTQRANIQNNSSLTEQAIQGIAGIYGQGSAIPLYGVIPDGRGDDFAYFQEKVPGVYFLLGGSNFEKGIIAMPHTPHFRVDETCIKSGVNYFSSLLIERTNN
ncbi:M20 metallopeptidase family protein [Echinicola vietnamensis]|uniref:M20 metallopeptidase family protein n=1 Tax=Echinicola vietnamensis TaxID=390884 RepID=UPI0012FBE45F|nr:M20/M25/M40 family metallo-hydrolase [Echinicola vietnamensis]